MAEEKSTSTKRTAPRRSRSTTSRTASRTPKPPNSVRPGWVHEALAKVTLALIQKQAPLPVDVGRVEQTIPDAISTEDNGTEPVDLLARVYAHAAHRVPGVKRVEKKLEGKDFSSGFLSDLGALLVQLYRRNQPAVDALMTDAASTVLSKRQEASTAAPMASPNGTQPPPPSPVPPMSPPAGFSPSAVPNE